MRKVLITGTAGFIGYHLAELLLAEGFLVQGYDAMTDYYDVGWYVDVNIGTWEKPYKLY